MPVLSIAVYYPTVWCTGVDLSASGGVGLFLTQGANHVISAVAITPADLPPLNDILPPTAQLT